MDFTEIIQFVFNNGLAVVLIFYYLKNNNETIKGLIKSNLEVVDALKNIAEKQTKIESCIIEIDKKVG